MISSGYTKLFSDIVTSTIWTESKDTKILWITMLALKNRDQIVTASVPGLARVAGMTVAECEAAMQKLMAPDPYSRTKSFEGRRVECVDGGWLILNGQAYRDKLSADERREYKRLKQAEYRKRKKDVVVSAQCEGAREAIADGFAEQRNFLPPRKDHPPTVEKRKAFTKPTMAEMELQAEKIGLPASEITHFFDYYESNGWKVGRNPMRSWQGAMANWKRNHENNRYRTTQGNARTNSQSNPRNVGVIKGPTDYGAAARRKLEREQETGVARQMDSPSSQSPATGGTGKLGL